MWLRHSSQSQPYCCSIPNIGLYISLRIPPWDRVYLFRILISYLILESWSSKHPITFLRFLKVLSFSEKDLAMWPRMALDSQIFCLFLQVLEDRYMPHYPVFPSFLITVLVVHFLFFMSKKHKHTQGCYNTDT